MSDAAVGGSAGEEGAATTGHNGGGVRERGALADSSTVDGPSACDHMCSPVGSGGGALVFKVDVVVLGWDAL
jgi:hypothetical protein